MKPWHHASPKATSIKPFSNDSSDSSSFLCFSAWVQCGLQDWWGPSKLNIAAQEIQYISIHVAQCYQHPNYMYSLLSIILHWRQTSSFTLQTFCPQIASSPYVPWNWLQDTCKHFWYQSQPANKTTRKSIIFATRRIYWFWATVGMRPLFLSYLCVVCVFVCFVLFCLVV